MIDMKNDQTIVILEDCDPTVSEAIQQFENRWGQYSISSRRYSIVRLMEEVIDPTVTAYMGTLPSRYSGYVPGAGTGVGISAIIRLVGLDAMVRLQQRLLRQFIKTENRQNSRDQRFIATLESLVGLVWDCACKRPKTSTSAQGVNLNAERKHGFCDLCGNLTEFSEFMAKVVEKQVNDVELENHRKLELSHQYCAGHRPKLMNGEWNPAYKQAKRSAAQFELELTRLSKQCAKPNLTQVNSGDRLVDDYFFHFVLGQTLQPADKGELRNQARLMVDSKLSDRKKQMLMLQQAGLNQSEIARRLGVERQAVSKALASIPAMFRLSSKIRMSRQPNWPTNKMK